MPCRSLAKSLLSVCGCALVVSSCADDPTGPEPDLFDAGLRPAHLVATTSASISGTTGATVDPVATNPQYYLRYTGDPAPAGSNHSFQWGTPVILTPSPEDGAVTFTGTIDVSDQVEGSVSMIGLIDPDVLPAGSSGHQSGAYMYIFRRTATEWRIGVTDGNAGGEIVQTFITILDPDMPLDGVFDVVLTIDGTADGTTCPPAGPVSAPAGCISLQVIGGTVNTTLHDSYGDVRGTGSGNPEFLNGGIPGWDDFPGANVHYDLTISPVLVLDGEGPVASNVLATPNPASVTQAIQLTADVDDAATGGSVISGAEYAIYPVDGSPSSWTAMGAQDGAFDEVAEAVSADVSAIAAPGLYNACVRGTDTAGNTGEPECTTLVVYDPAGGFVTGGGWFESGAGAYMPSDNTVVTEADIDQATDPDVDWLRTTAGAGAGTFVSGPGAPPLGSGSFQMTSTAGSDKVTLFNYDHIGTLLADISAISYATYRDGASTNSAAQYPSLNIQVDFVGDGSSFTTLVWEPIYAYGAAALQTDTWQTWDAMTGAGWWSTAAIPGVCSFNCFVSWDDIVAANPDAKVKFGFGINIGSGWAGTFSGAVDALSLTTGAGTTTYDLEASAPAPPAGKATFGFVSKYKKGASTPDGNTQFQFKAAGLDFHSTSYDWLVVNQGGENAQFKGAGTINGSGAYQFMLWAGDHDSGDTFRIKIWEDSGSGELVVYDNGFDQMIGGGNIIVHDGKGK